MTHSIQYTLNGHYQPEEILSLFQAVGFTIRPLSTLVGAISGSTAYITARDGDKLIGFGRLMTDYHDLAYINYMAVDPNYQRKGVGQSMLHKLVEASGNVERVFLYTNTADAFYVRYGFTPSEKRLYIYRKQKTEHDERP
jgi:N-acetylglutamate synthase-like GNAT family acetyltransferase